MTLDGYRYTFNGRGEFHLIRTHSETFTLQGRMTHIDEPAKSSPSFSQLKMPTMATAITAIVAREIGADIIQFEVSRGSLILHVNGQPQPIIAEEMKFKNVTVYSSDPHSLAVTFKTGVHLEVRLNNSFLSYLLVSLPERYTNKTMGLLGSYNGDSSDDLLPRFSNISMPHNSSLTDIHNNFGITCEDECCAF